MLRLRLRAYSDVAGVNVFDANGVLINSSENWPVPNVRIADRNFFKAFKSGSPFERFRIELLQGRFSPAGLPSSRARSPVPTANSWAS